MDLQASVAGPSRARSTFSEPSVNQNPSFYNPPSSSSRSSTPSHSAYGRHSTLTPGLHGRSSTPSIYGRSSTPSIYGGGRSSTPLDFHGRSSTPILYPNGARFRSSSVITSSQKSDEEFMRQRRESVNKLKSSWDLLNEKYGMINLEDDDEIDLRTGKIIKDRGRLRNIEKRDFGELSSNNEDEGEYDDDEDDGASSSILSGARYEVESDEDEMGLWDERSGLDPQILDPPLLLDEDDDANDAIDDQERRKSRAQPKPKMTEQDHDDLKEFLKMEAERNRLMNEVSLSDLDDVDDNNGEHQDEDGDESSPEPLDHEERERLISPRFRGTRILPASRLEDLFSSDVEKTESSEDELQVIGGDSDDDNDSIDESSAASDDETFRTDSVVTLPKPRRSKTIEVVIPIGPRQRRMSLPSTIVPQSSSIPQQSVKDALKRSATAPSLADLFNTPPRDDDLCSRSPSPAPSHSHGPAASMSPVDTRQYSVQTLSPSPPPRHSTIEQVSPASISPPHIASTAKGKERMAGERSTDIVQPHWGQPDSPYFIRLWRNRLGTVRSCKKCKKAGGERAEKAPWCKGRKSSDECRLDRGLKQTHAETDRSDEDEGEDDRENTRKRSKSKPPSNQNQDIDSHTSQTEIVMGTERASARTTTHNDHDNPGTGRIRRCPLCKEAGGERAQEADTCQGKVSYRRCYWYIVGSGSEMDSPAKRRASSIISRRSMSRRPDDVSDSDNTPIIMRPTRSGPRPRQILTMSGSEDEQSPALTTRLRRNITMEPEGLSMELPARPNDLDSQRYARGFKLGDKNCPRRCKLCNEAGGIRAERAWWCKGRSWTKFCSFLDDQNDSAISEVQLVKESNTIIPGPNSKTPETVIRSSSVSRTKRKRVVSNARTNSPTSSPVLQPIHDSAQSTNTAAYIPSPPATSSVEPYSPLPDPSSRNIRLTASGRSPSSFSTPPSSPPVFSIRPVHPTPSPSLSAVQTNDSPMAYKSTQTLARGTTLAFRPTPPPSLDGARSSSLLSDKVSSSLPRKSALRRPSSDSCPSSGSVKRARFSLVPRSPPREISSDPLDDHNDRFHEDESSMHDMSVDYSSPYHPDGSFSTSTSISPAFNRNRYAVNSSSPLRTEWSVRAADIGIKLGPEHTGSLPKGMIKALAPSLSTFNPTLGSSISVVKQFGLPTPPLGTGSMSTSTSTPTSKASGGGSGMVGAGLMLPPPVPLKRSTPAPMTSPSISTSTSATTPTPTPTNTTASTSAIAAVSTSYRKTRDRFTTPVQELASEPIKFTSQPAAYIRALVKSRSRSRSVSVVTSSISTNQGYMTPSTKRVLRAVNSTPRRKSRVERELARVARDLGDDAGLEWGLDEDTEDGGRMWREGSVVSFVA
ncbi:uncharacterized protein IL334_006180 [Kwoniella shivajii]|uniref:Uncharacterized protein n=1 Tax=Kwoniella shivajii TaxID=564305 RepID=A0ABZ1D5S9_9TREE|nr:hypothetical protein IL334_006180 [Kwoniella shivajii]